MTKSRLLFVTTAGLLAGAILAWQLLLHPRTRDVGTAPLAARARNVPKRASSGGTAPSGQAIGIKSSRSVQTVVNGGGFWPRHQAAQALGRHLRRDEIDALYAWLRTRDYPADEKARGGERVLKNDVLSVLRRQFPVPSDLQGLLVALYRDRRQDETIRGYALQHLGVLCVDRLLAGEAGPREATTLSEAVAVLCEGAGEPVGTVAGTALIALHDLSPYLSGASRNEATDRALRLLTAPGATDLNRATALQICALNRQRAALPIAVDLAQRAPEIGLQLAAIHALGQLGTRAEAARLEGLLAATDPIVRTAAATALAHLRQHLGLGKE